MKPRLEGGGSSPLTPGGAVKAQRLWRGAVLRAGRTSASQSPSGRDSPPRTGHKPALAEAGGAVGGARASRLGGVGDEIQSSRQGGGSSRVEVGRGRVWPPEDLSTGGVGAPALRRAPAQSVPEWKRGGREGAHPTTQDPRSDVRPGAQVGMGAKGRRAGDCPRLGRELGTDPPLRPWRCGGEAPRPRPVRMLARDRGKASEGAPFPRRAGAEPGTLLPHPGWRGPPRGGAPGERRGASPSQSRPPSGRLCRRAPQQRRLPCAVGVSASLGEWGRPAGAGGGGEGQSRGRGPRPGLLSPRLPAPPGLPPARSAGSWTPPGDARRSPGS